MKEILQPHEIKSFAVNFDDTIEFKRVQLDGIKAEINEKIKKWEKNWN